MKILRRLTALAWLPALALIVALPAAAGEGHAYGRVKQELRAYFDGLEEEGLSGSVLVAHRGKVLLAEGYGMADYEADIPNEADTVHAIASMTKAFTAVSILMLQERGLLSLEDTIDQYIPWYPGGDQIKIRHLLSQTSGIFEMTNHPDLWPLFGVFHTPEQLFDYFMYEPLSFEPGTAFEYSNSNYVTAGLIVEYVSGLSYRDFLAQNILGPLGMERTSYDPYEVDFPDKAVGYLSLDPPVVAWNLHPSVPYAAGAIHSTVLDLYRWDQALLGEGLLSEESLEAMYTPGLGDYGYGWFIDEMEVAGGSYRHVWHWGGYVGFHSYFSRLKDEGVTVIVLCNTDPVLGTPDELRPLAEHAAAIVLSGHGR